MNFDFSAQKVMVCGLQGSGKTHKARELVADKKVLVFSPHSHDWRDTGDNIIYYRPENNQYNNKTLELFLELAKNLCKINQIEGILIDEFDMYLQNNFQIGDQLNDVILNHRHIGKGLFLIAITRRPQDIPAKMFESSKFIICFALQGANAQKKFNDMWKGWGDQIISLDYAKHQYTYKEIGKPPVLVTP